MGLHKFSSMFKYTRPVQIIDMAGERVAIDAFWKLYQSLLAMEKVNTLTDKDGNPTAHIQTLLSNIIQMHRSGVKQIWVFDYQEPVERKEKGEHHNPAKQLEIEKRRQKKDVNQVKIQALTLEMFSNSKKLDFDDLDDTDNNPGESKIEPKRDIQSEIDELQKRNFQVTTAQVQDLKKMLDLLGIPYVEGIKGFEGEHIASYLVQQDIADAVFSGDSDPMAFGAKKLYRKVKKDIFEYDIEDIINQIKARSKSGIADLETFRRISVIMGTDFCNKTPGLGPQKVFEKYSTTNLTSEQKKAMEEFAKLDNAKLDIRIVNQDAVPFEKKNVEKLIDWLVDVKGFNRNRLTEVLAKAAAPVKSKNANLFQVAERKLPDRTLHSTENKPTKGSPEKRSTAKRSTAKKSQVPIKIVIDESELSFRPNESAKILDEPVISQPKPESTKTRKANDKK